MCALTEAPTSDPITITLTRYREPDWLVMETLESLALQEGVNGDVLFLDQNRSKSFTEAVEALSTPQLRFRCLPCAEKGLSHARNEGLRLASSPVVLFIDCDAVAERRWAREMSKVLRTGAAVVGARILPRWRGRSPLLARAKVVRDQYSLLDWGEDVAAAPRVVGAGFGLRKDLCADQMIFDEGLGRRDGKLFSGEESDLCRRVAAAGGRIMYCGKAVVHHQILPERLKLSWIMKRLYFAGLGRAAQGGAPSPSQKPGFWDWALLPLILPPYAAGYIIAPHRGRYGAASGRDFS